MRGISKPNDDEIDSLHDASRSAASFPPGSKFYTPEGRPVKVVNNGKVIHELLG